MCRSRRSLVCGGSVMIPGDTYQLGRNLGEFGTRSDFSPVMIILFPVFLDSLCKNASRSNLEKKSQE